nr:MAG TPA: hypothetical protein [Caudoviricetes sp.]
MADLREKLLHYTDDLSEDVDLRREAITTIEQAAQYMTEDELLHHSRALAIAYLALTDAADVAPVMHSYWEHKITSNEENIGICHNCKYPVSWFWGQTRYCPNCGAKMDESMPKDGAD